MSMFRTVDNVEETFQYFLDQCGDVEGIGQIIT